jgi:hypothetical protein
MPLNTELIQAKWVLRQLPTEVLPGIAADLLESGKDSSAIRRVAAHVSPTWFDVHEDFEKVLAELGLPKITQEQAWLVLARDMAKQIIEGRIAPETGAAQLAHFGLDQPYQDYGTSYANEMLEFELLIIDKDQFDESTRIEISNLAKKFLDCTSPDSR